MEQTAKSEKVLEKPQQLGNAYLELQITYKIGAEMQDYYTPAFLL
jgi:hypothetical protein